MRFSFLLLSLSSFLFTNAQIFGRITDMNNQALANVNIYIENTYTGTTSNEDGFYVLNYEPKPNETIVFKLLGYKTIKKTITSNTDLSKLNAQLYEEEIALATVEINSKENPANPIIRAVIANRKNQKEKINNYTADFYSKGWIRIENAPEKFLGQEIGDLGGGLDSTRTGLIYLSETMSKIKFIGPKNFNEKIIASKVSGDDNGFSFNAASDVDFNFYNNTIEIGNQIISPIASNAFDYYRFKLEGVFYDDYGNLINKIALTPKRATDDAFKGTIYIVEDQWVIYGLDLYISGAQAQIPPAKTININQNYSYSKIDNTWVLLLQNISFDYAFFGLKGDGLFVANYSNYNLNAQLNNNKLSNEILVFDQNANNKDSSYWKNQRPVPLTDFEKQDYVTKDSIQEIRQSKTYLDSIDAKNNKFNILNIITGYSYSNSYENKRFEISSPLNSIGFNTVQGFNSNLKISYTKQIDEYRKYFNLSGQINYGYSDDKPRAEFNAYFKLNNIKKPTFYFSAGTALSQFNRDNPISKNGNSLSTLFFKNNFMKVYESRFANFSYWQELFNGFTAGTSVKFEERQNLFNSTGLSWTKNERPYTSNNPLSPNNVGSSAFINHKITLLNFYLRINFNQKYMSYPGSKFNISSNKYPEIVLNYTSGLGADVKDYNFTHLRTRIFQMVDFDNKGDLQYNLKAGTFFNDNNIAFMDYKHFNGNQTDFSFSGDYLNSFKNLDYYALSTNEPYIEFHSEYDFKGYIMDKIPLVNKLNFNFILGLKSLWTKTTKPYREISFGIDNVGWGKLRFLRIDYVQSYRSSFLEDTFMIGISL